MIFTPEKYRIPDKRMEPFIDPDEIWEYLNELPKMTKQLFAV